MSSLRSRIAKLEEETALAELKSPLDGVELMELFQQPPGRWIADVKDHLRELVIDGVLAPGDKERARNRRGVLEPAGEVGFWFLGFGFRFSGFGSTHIRFRNGPGSLSRL